MPFGTPGELWIRGYSIMSGYFEDEAKTNEMITNQHWLKTGDQFILEADGYGKVVGRIKDMIIRGGENIYPKEIEDFLNTHPSVLDTAVRITFQYKFSSYDKVFRWLAYRMSGWEKKCVLVFV